MRRKLNISKSKNTLVLIMGMLAAMTILSGQIYNAQITAPIEVNQEEASEANDQSQQTIVKAVDAVSTAVQVSITHQFYFISEILHSEENQEESIYLELPKLSTFFTTLFRQIISPNAP